MKLTEFVFSEDSKIKSSELRTIHSSSFGFRVNARSFDASDYYKMLLGGNYICAEPATAEKEEYIISIGEKGKQVLEEARLAVK